MKGKKIETSHSCLCSSLALELLILKVKLGRQRPWAAHVLSRLCGLVLKHFQVWVVVWTGAEMEMFFLLESHALANICSSTHISNLSLGIRSDPVNCKEYYIFYSFRVLKLQRLNLILVYFPQKLMSLWFYVGHVKDSFLSQIIKCFRILLSPALYDSCKRPIN